MRKFILPVLFLHLAFAVKAATYYFSKSGNDSYTATQAQSQSTPWKSLSKLNAIMLTLKPGDQVLFKRGETFIGNLNITVSGTSTAPIFFGAYGTGNKPIISGFNSLTSWTKVSGNIWECPFWQSSASENMVTKAGVQQAIGRYPNRNAANGGYLIIDSHSGLTQLTSKQLPSSPNWVGADIAIRKNRWVIDRSKVTYHSGNTIGFASGSDNSITDKYGFFIENSPNTLDQDGEWYYDASRAKMQMYFADNNPNAYTCFASVYDELVTISFRNYLTFDNLMFRGANNYIFNLTNTSYIKINACNLNFSGINAIQGLSTSYVTISNSAINDANNNGVNLYWNCSNTTINNNIVNRTALIPGMNQNNVNAFIGISLRGDNNLIQYNEIDSSGTNGIHFEGDYSTVQNNFVNYFGLTADDCGGIYTGQGQGTYTTYNYKGILNNIVLNGIGAPKGTEDTSNTTLPSTQGIYLDENTNHVTVSGNTVANCGQAGIFPHVNTYIQVLNNTMYNNGKEQLMIVRDYNPVSDVNVKGNIMFSRTATQLCAKIETYYGSNNISGTGTIDGNYYCRPIDNNYIFYDMYLSNGQYIQSYENMSTWRSKYGFDPNSKGAPATFPAFTASNVSGTNKYSNASFSSSVGDVGSYASTGDISKIWVSNKLDGGTLQATSNTYTSNNNYALTFPLNSGVTAGKSYLVKFSLQSGGNNSMMQVYLRQNSPTQFDITSRTFIPLSTTRQEITLGFTATATTANPALELDVAAPNGAVWIDNVSVQEATITPTNPDDYIRFEYNASTSSKTISLSSTYLDAKGASYSGNVTIAPYSSLVLFKQAGTTAASFTAASEQQLSAKGSLVDASAASYTSTAEADVNWQVDNQDTSAAYYQVERSADNAHFSVIGKTLAKSSGDKSLSYQYNDATPESGKNFYKITQYDAKGTAVVSKIVMVNNISFTINPNPAKDVIHLTFNKAITSDDKLAKEMLIRNTAGTTVKTIQLPSSNNLSRFDVNVADLQSGVYILSVTSDGQTISKKFLKQ